jgi:hypothetical protein
MSLPWSEDHEAAQMTTKSLLRVVAWLFLLAGLGGLGGGAWQYGSGGSPAEYGVLAIGGTFWLICSAVALFLRTRLP